MNVRLGEYNTRETNDCEFDKSSSNYNPAKCATSMINIEVSELTLHEAYDKNSNTAHNDIALLRLKDKVEYSEYVAPICLPWHSMELPKDQKFEIAGLRIKFDFINLKL